MGFRLVRRSAAVVFAAAATAAIAASFLSPSPARAVTANVEAIDLDCNPGAGGTTLTPAAHVTRHAGSPTNVSVVMMLLDGGVQIAQRGAGTQSVPVGSTNIFQVLAPFDVLTPGHTYTVRVRMADAASGDFAFGQFQCQTAAALDTDGDGFSDPIETAYVSDLFDPASTPIVPPGEIADPLSTVPPDVDCGILSNGIDTCKLRPGDVFVWRFTGFSSTIEEELGSTYFSHMGIVLGRWRLSNNPFAHVEVVMADITPNRTIGSVEGELGLMAADSTSIGEAPPDGPVAAGVYRGAGLALAAREAAARAAMSIAMDHGAANPANQGIAGWAAPDADYAHSPFAFGPDAFYCSSYVGRAFGLEHNPQLIWPLGLVPMLLEAYFTPDDLLAWLPGRAAVTTFGKQKGGVISLLSPAHVLVTDPLGRRAGLDSSGTFWAEIPEAVWRQTAVNESVTAPEIDATWSVTLSGHDEGLYHLATRGVTDDAPTPAAVVPGFTRPGLVETFSLAELPDRQHFPVAVDDTVATTAGVPVGVGVLANDFDPDGDSVTLVGSSNGAGGNVSCTAGGQCTYTPDAGFSGPDAFTYTITDGTATDAATVHVTVAPNHPPDCSPVGLKPTSLWPANHRLVPIALSGATDQDGDPLVLRVTGVTQDEATNGLGDGDTAPDASAGEAAAEVFVRAERSGKGDGRVYRIDFSVADGKGGTCIGRVRLSVPQKSGGTAVDSAPPSYNSFAP
jgi:hypothetical protein